MSHFVVGPLDVADAQEFDAYNTRLTGELQRMVADGSAKSVDGLDYFYDVSERLRIGIAEASQSAAAKGETSVTVRVPMTVAEHRMLGSLGASLQTYMEILEMRGKVDMQPSEGTIRAMTALMSGRLED
jgi:hypothetical protein